MNTKLLIFVVVLGLTIFMLLPNSTPSEPSYKLVTDQTKSVIPDTIHQNVPETLAQRQDIKKPQPGETEQGQITVETESVPLTVESKHVSLGQNMSFIPVEELPPAYANATYSAVELESIDIGSLEKDDTVELYVPQISKVVDFQVAEVVEDDYGLSMIALSNDTGNILTLTRSDPLQAEGYLEINGDRYSLIQFKDKLLIVNAKGFFKVPTGDHDDIAIPPVNIVE